MSIRHDVRPYGPGALLVTPREGVRPADFARVVCARPDVGEVVSGAETVLVEIGDRGSRERLALELAHLGVGPTSGREATDGRDVAIEVVYDGVDLAEVARSCGVAVADVVAMHSGATYRCEFCGFAPGFAYLAGLDPRLVLPRRDTPRTSVPAGSVAIAGPYTAVYPSASPGGWHLLGRTDAVLWDSEAEPPALVTPGTRVTFRPVSEFGSRESRNPGSSTPRSGGETQDTQISGARILVVRPGMSTSLQDGGRFGYASVAVPRAGALDGALRDLVNRLVGNPPDQAVLETAGGLVLEAIEHVVVADSTSGAVQTLQPGQRITIDPRHGEVYAYLAARGGFDVAPVLGSRSWDTLSKLGPPVPQTSDRLRVGADPRTAIVADLAPSASPPRPLLVRVWRGPRADWLGAAAFGQLVAADWVVSPEISRVGVRLIGPAVERERQSARELPSEGLVTGAIQIPPDGQPVVMLNDHPTTGGYPVLGVVDERDLGLLAQARPGSAVHMREVTR